MTSSRPDEDIVKTLMVMAELYNKEFSQAAAEMLVRRLSRFPKAQVLAALDLCVDECRFFPSVAEIIDRISYGHPGPEEAWAMLPKREADTAVLTDVMMEAYGSVYKLMQSDHIAGRKAFLEVYGRGLTEAKRMGAPPNWQVSFGHDVSGREGPIIEAINKGYIDNGRATSLLGYDPLGERGKALTYSEVIRKLELMPPIEDKEQQDEVKVGEEQGTETS